MKLFYLAILSFVFLSTSAISFSRSVTSKELGNYLSRRTKTFPDLPILKSGNTSFPVISAQSAVAIDLESGISLYEKDPQKRLLPASTTKIMTALVAMDVYSPETILKVDKIKIDGQKMGLAWGEEMTVNDLLYGLLVYSANDAAEVLAGSYPQGRQAFIDLMNEKARRLNLTNTHFSNPTGFDSNTHYSTAEDLVTISRYAMNNPLFAQIVGTKEKLVKSVNGNNSHKLVNINKLLGSVDGVLGVKTGWTENARENLVTYVVRDNKKIMLVVLGSQDRFGETKELIDWVFTNYNWEKVVLTYPFKTI